MLLGIIDIDDKVLRIIKNIYNNQTASASGQ